MREAASRCNKLHRAGRRTATNYANSGHAETNLYAHPYAQNSATFGNKHLRRLANRVDRPAVIGEAEPGNLHDRVVEASELGHSLPLLAEVSASRRCGKPA